MPTMNPEQLQELGATLDKMRASGFLHTRNWNTYHQAGLRYIYGDQGVTATVKEGWDPVVHNHIFPAVMQELAVQSQRSQTILARPQEVGDTAGASFWQGHLQWLFREELKTDMFLLRAALDGKVYGRYIAYNYWDPEADWDEEAREWKGAIRVRLVSPEYFASDPETDDFDQAEFVVTRRRMPLELAIHRWPEYKAEIIQTAHAGEDEWFTNNYGVDDTGLGRLGMSTLGIDGARDPGVAMTDLNRLTNLLTQSRKQQATGIGITDGVESRYVTIEQFFFKDRTTRNTGGTEDIPENELEANGIIVRDGENGGIWLDAKTKKPISGKDWPQQKTESKKEPAYPRGRMVLRVGNTILNRDTDQQRWSQRKWPFTVGLNQILPHSQMGLNDVEMARVLQDRVNVGGLHLMNWMRSFADPQIVMEEDALAPGRKLSNKAGAVIKLTKGNMKNFKREAAPPLAQGVFQIMSQQTADLRDQTGVQEVGLGKTGEGTQTAREVIALQTNTRLRGALSNKLLDMFLKDLYGRIAEQSARMYSAGDIVRVIGEDGQATAVQITEGVLDAKFDINLEVGTELPFDKEVEQQKALAVFQAVGIAYMPQLLSAFDVKNIDEVLAAHAEYQSFLQFQQALEEQQAEAEKAQGTQGGESPQSDLSSLDVSQDQPIR